MPRRIISVRLPSASRGKTKQLNIKQSGVQHVGTSYEQEIQWQDGTKTRREIFVGRCREELDHMIAERVRKLRRKR